MGEFDSIDDELFSLDYRAERPAAQASVPPVGHADVPPEPPTVRLEERAPPHTDPGGTRFDQDSNESTGEIAMVIAFAVLLVVVVAATGLVLWWWA